MNKETRKFKKVIKARKRRLGFEQQQVGAKIKKDRMLKKERIAYKFEKLQRSVENKRLERERRPVTMAL